MENKTQYVEVSNAITKSYQSFQQILKTICQPQHVNAAIVWFKEATFKDKQVRINITAITYLIGSENIVISDQAQGQEEV